jgi:uncharacterized membrane protein YdfJ with MMPL/SSD domain
MGHGGVELIHRRRIADPMFGLLFASMGTLVQAGFVMGVGLLLDTFLVRTITVPAMTVLVGLVRLVAVIGSEASAGSEAPVEVGGTN